VKLYFEDAAFDGQLQRSVGKVDAGMASVGECLAIAEQVIAGDRESWYQAWSDLEGLSQRGYGHLISNLSAVSPRMGGRGGAVTI
jgi:hypothetical protein